MKKCIVWLLIAVLLWTSGGLTAVGYDSTYLSNARFHTLSKSEATQKYNNGEKFILYCYRTTCSNCQYIGSTAVTSWMNDYGKDIYGVNADTDMPSFAYSYFGNSITLPGVLFINNKTASAHSLNKYSSLSEMKTALNNEFVSFTGASTPTFSLGSAECSAGQTVDLPVTVSGNPGICTTKLTISYSQSQLELVSASNGTVLTEGFTPGGNVSQVPYSVVWNSGTKSSNANGTMVTFTFKVKSGIAAGTKAAVTLSYSKDDTMNANLDPVTFQTQSGSITVKGATVYTLTFNDNGGSGGPGSQTGNGTITLSSTKPSKTGYAFLGWSTSSTATSASYSAGGSFSLTNNTTLYAVWKANTYSVKFNGNGATSGSMSNQTFTYDVAQNLTANAFKRAYTVTYSYNGATGGNSASSATATSTFNGWATSAGGSKVYNDKASVKNLTDSGTYNLYANWTAGTVTLPTPTKTGNTFSGWYTNSSLTNYAGAGGAKFTPTANTTLYAKWATAALSSIAVTTKPTKTSYIVGETLNTSGMVVRATYSDGSTANVTGYTCSPTQLTAVGTKAITVSYTEDGITKTTSFTVTVVKKTLSSLSVTTKPAKTTYTVGETLDTSGMVVRATYSDGSTANVTGYTCSPTTLNKEGSQTITVSYTEGGVTKTTSFTVTVANPTLTGIEVKTMPTKTTYYVGESFNQNGLTLTATYSNGSTKTITSGFTCTGFNGSAIGKQSITVSYTEGSVTKKKTFTVTVISAKEPAFSLSSAECSAGQTVSLPVTVSNNPGICTAKLSINYDKSLLELVSATNGSVLTNGFTAGGDVTKVPYSVVWNSGTSASNTNGTMVTFKFKVKSGVAAGTKATVTLSYSKNDTLDANLNPVTFQTSNGSITVKSAAAALSQIAVKTMPTKTAYAIGESFNQSGLTLTATYSDGSTKTITSGFTCTGFSAYSTGKKTVTVTYEGKSTTFTVEVKAPKVSIRNYVEQRTVDYKTTITFTADTEYLPAGTCVCWIYADKTDSGIRNRFGKGNSFTVNQATSSFVIGAVIADEDTQFDNDDPVYASSEVEQVIVKSGFFARLKAFFRGLFGLLPKVTQEYLGFDFIDKMLP